MKCGSCSAKILNATLNKKLSRTVGSECIYYCSDYCKSEHAKKFDTTDSNMCAVCSESISGTIVYKSPEQGISPAKVYCSSRCMDVCKTDILKCSGRTTRSISGLHTCKICKKLKPQYKYLIDDEIKLYLCSEACYLTQLSQINGSDTLPISPSVSIVEGTKTVKQMGPVPNGYNRCVTCNKISSTNIVKITLHDVNKPVYCCTSCIRKFLNESTSNISCVWCKKDTKISKMTELIENSHELKLFCSLRCKSLYRVNVQALSTDTVNCDQCLQKSQAQYHLTMSDASVRNFCSFACVLAFQNKFGAGSTSAKPTTTVKNLGKQSTPGMSSTCRHNNYLFSPIEFQYIN